MQSPSTIEYLKTLAQKRKIASYTLAGLTREKQQEIFGSIGAKSTSAGAMLQTLIDNHVKENNAINQSSLNERDKFYLLDILQLSDNFYLQHLDYSYTLVEEGKNLIRSLASGDFCDQIIDSFETRCTDKLIRDFKKNSGNVQQYANEEAMNKSSDLSEFKTTLHVAFPSSHTQPEDLARVLTRTYHYGVTKEIVCWMDAWYTKQENKITKKSVDDASIEKKVITQKILPVFMRAQKKITKKIFSEKYNREKEKEQFDNFLRATNDYIAEMHGISSKKKSGSWHRKRTSANDLVIIQKKWNKWFESSPLIDIDSENKLGNDGKTRSKRFSSERPSSKEAEIDPKLANTPVIAANNLARQEDSGQDETKKITQPNDTQPEQTSSSKSVAPVDHVSISILHPPTVTTTAPPLPPPLPPQRKSDNSASSNVKSEPLNKEQKNGLPPKPNTTALLSGISSFNKGSLKKNSQPASSENTVGLLSGIRSFNKGSLKKKSQPASSENTVGLLSGIRGFNKGSLKQKPQSEKPQSKKSPSSASFIDQIKGFSKNGLHHHVKSNEKPKKKTSSKKNGSIFDDIAAAMNKRGAQIHGKFDNSDDSTSNSGFSSGSD